MPERARARRADWAPGPGVLVELPNDVLVSWLSPQISSSSVLTTSSADLDVEGSDAELLAADGDVLSGQHGGVGGGLVTVGLDLHATGDTGDGLTATGITQVSLCTIFLKCQNARIFFQIRRPLDGCCSDVREIGDVDEGVVEGGEDTGNAEDELAWRDMLLARGPGFCNFCVECRLSGSRVVAELAGSGCLTLADLGAQGDVLLGSADSSFLGGHFDGICWGGGIEIAEVVRPRKEEVGGQTLRRAGCGPAELESAPCAEKLAKSHVAASSSLLLCLAAVTFESRPSTAAFFLLRIVHKRLRLSFFPIHPTHIHHHTTLRSRTPQRQQAFSCARRVR